MPQSFPLGVCPCALCVHHGCLPSRSYLIRPLPVFFLSSALALVVPLSRIILFYQTLPKSECTAIRKCESYSKVERHVEGRVRLVGVRAALEVVSGRTKNRSDQGLYFVRFYLLSTVGTYLVHHSTRKLADSGVGGLERVEPTYAHAEGRLYHSVSALTTPAVVYLTTFATLRRSSACYLLFFVSSNSVCLLASARDLVLFYHFMSLYVRRSIVSAAVHAPVLYGCSYDASRNQDSSFEAADDSATARSLERGVHASAGKRLAYETLAGVALARRLVPRLRPLGPQLQHGPPQLALPHALQAAGVAAAWPLLGNAGVLEAAQRAFAEFDVAQRLAAAFEKAGRDTGRQREKASTACSRRGTRGASAAIAVV
ncbi:hypothetical protein FIBSPDRAFT_993381 [Athelia psychrophila]|uniref:Uncharacterized protein n=1 Tax=Athelia psychrophila TaxID=1759441 RepID=A0A165YE37_9AGAM|nr:hypothetical protein FIBSPDRAFT_993381 [Fibularhizoctonia sp. CBS 109695]